MAEGVVNLSTRLNHLFESVPAPEGGLYTNAAAARALRDSGVQVTAQHLWLLRSGQRDNPSFRLLEGIAKLFGVPLVYFSDPDPQGRGVHEVATLSALRDAGVRALLARAHGLSARGVEQLEALAEQIRRLEGLEPDDAAGV